MESISKNHQEFPEEDFKFEPLNGLEKSKIKNSIVRDIDYVLFASDCSKIVSERFNPIFDALTCKFVAPQIIKFYSNSIPLAVKVAQFGSYHVGIPIQDPLEQNLILQKTKQALVGNSIPNRDLNATDAKKHLYQYFSNCKIVCSSYGQKSSLASVENYLSQFLQCDRFEVAIGGEFYLEDYFLAVAKDTRRNFEFHSHFFSSDACNVSCKVRNQCAALAMNAYKFQCYNNVHHSQKDFVAPFHYDFKAQDTANSVSIPFVTQEIWKTIYERLEGLVNFFDVTKLRCEAYFSIGSREDYDEAKASIIPILESFSLLKTSCVRMNTSYVY
ncbi:MAG: hypothetical protein AB7F43_15305 [Bacteriovoracia bacterium]